MKANSQAGFSLLELLVTVALMSILMGAIFAQLDQAQKNATSQQTKLDLFQESREFMDQIARDLRASGYPNTRNFSSDPVSPAEQSTQEAVGLVKLDVGQLWFESSIDGSGNVSVIHYNVVQTVSGCACSTACPCLLERSQTAKIQADPLTGQTETNQVDVQSVLNGTSADPIFRAYYSDGTSVTLPIDITTACSTNDSCLADVNTVDIVLKVQSPNLDPVTGLRPTITLTTTVRLNNCSIAYPSTTGTVMGCK